MVIFKDETLSLQGIRTLSKIDIYSKMMKNFLKCTWTIISIYYNKLQKQLFQNSWQKKHAILFYTNPLAHCIMFAPNK